MESDRQKSEANRRHKNGGASPSRPGNQVTGEKTGRKKRFEIDIFRDWCKSCGICAAFCPLKCIALDEEGAPAIIHSDRCTGCGWCEIHCPDFAISVHQKNNHES